MLGEEELMSICGGNGRVCVARHAFVSVTRKPKPIGCIDRQRDRQIDKDREITHTIMKAEEF